MKTKSLKLTVFVFLMACILPLSLLSNDTASDINDASVGKGIGDPEVLRAKYLEWESQYVKDGGDRNMVLALKWSKGLSSNHTNAYGRAKLNLLEGKITVEIKGLPRAKMWDIWIINNSSSIGNSVLPEQSDKMLYAGSFKSEGSPAIFEADLGSEAFMTCEPELVVVTPGGKSPTEDRVLVATTTLFHRLYRSGQRGHFGKLDDSENQVAAPPDSRSLFGKLVDLLSPTAHAQSPTDPLSALVATGRVVFFKEQFDGNGRTCGTCHRENNNLTIDPAFIATLPITDPLFVAETQAPLSQNFENPLLMRNVGLILENVDGFDNLQTKFAMRSVPHTLAMPTSLRPTPPDVDVPDGTTMPPDHRTGWGGDGAPFNETVVLGDGQTHFTAGTLRDFAIGAVRQHFTLTLNRVPNTDFRFPTNAELDALEAFQLSTGRPQDLQLPLSLKGPLPSLGQTKFLNPFVENGIACNACHFNAGANANPAVFPSNFNRNFDTNVEDFPNPPGKLFGRPVPSDGGFGATPCTGPNGGPPCGNNTFNTPPVVEAADTAPFFHNNAVNTIEGAVQFYIQGVPASFSTRTTSDVQAIAAFLRVINALENIRSAIAFENRAKLQTTMGGAAILINLAIADAQDGVEVLNGQSLHPDAAFLLTRSIGNLQIAATTSDQTARNLLIQTAISQQNQAKGKMIN